MKRTESGMHIFLFSFLLVISLITLFPVVYTFISSFKSTQELLSSGSLLPKVFTFKNYIKAWVQVDFARYTLNSVIICMLVVCGVVLFNSMTAYVLARKKNLPGIKVLWILYLSAIFISLPVATIYPIFQLIIDLKLNTTILGMVLVGMGDIATIFIIMGYIRGISREIDESATIDGCGFFRIYWNIIMPLAKPVLVTVALLTFRGAWNSYLMPLILTMGNKKILPLTVAIVELKSSGEGASDVALMCTSACISLIPMIIVYIFTSKHFMSGLTDGAVKG